MLRTVCARGNRGLVSLRTLQGCRRTEPLGAWGQRRGGLLQRRHESSGGDVPKAATAVSERERANAKGGEGRRGAHGLHTALRVVCAGCLLAGLSSDVYDMLHVLLARGRSQRRFEHASVYNTLPTGSSSAAELLLL